MKKHIPGSVNLPFGCDGRFSVEVNDQVIWNRQEFITFLIKHQNKVIDVEIPEGACLQSLGIYDLLAMFEFRAVTVRTNNIVEHPPAPYILDLHVMAFQYFNIPPVDYTPYHTWNGNKIFGAFYSRPSWHRIGLTGHLLSNHSAQTTMNFRFDPRDTDTRHSFEIDKLFQVDVNSVKNFTNIIEQLPVRLEETDGYTVGASTQEHTDQLSQFYTNFLVDVVSETFVRGRSFYPTEKTTRPMLMKKPFIHMGPKCFLAHLHQMGFKTFFEFWDETYDGYQPEEKYIKILKIIDSIARKSTNELQDMYASMQPILDHNYELLTSGKFSKKITHVE